ncbi:PASTA domain-containing protein, partial [Streptomyces sp. NPDC005904]|uniref:Stk1 family PASTA domain-containing Ser/Thr kinase n=1 Tax=Streptomyces sp. NPDC005904 TaxID=3154570 RepID=UPI0033DEF4F7
AGQDPLNRSSVLPTPPAAPAAPVRPGRRRLDPRRRTLAMVAAVLLALGLGAGVWYINSGQFTEVPPVLAKTEAQARKRLADAGLEVKEVKRAYSDTDKRGTVMDSDPEAGDRIRQNDQVTLTVSRGPEKVKVPDVKDIPLARAKQELKNSGLAPGMVTKGFSDSVEKGSVISTDPRAGFTRKADSAVALVVSKGRAVQVPDVTGDSEADATSELEDAGLKVRIDPNRKHSDEDKGAVVEQSPGADRQLAEGDTVTLVLSKGPPMVKVPDVTGMSVDDAVDALEGAGFDVDKDRGLLGLFGDTVKKQSVDGGDKAPKGSTITIEIR